MPQDQMSHLWRGAADVIVEPDVAGFAYDDFKRAGELIRAGEVAMRKPCPKSANGWTRQVMPVAAKSRPAMARPAPCPRIIQSIPIFVHKDHIWKLRAIQPLRA